MKPGDVFDETFLAVMTVLSMGGDVGMDSLKKKGD